MNVLVMFYTRTGRTEALAREIAAGVALVAGAKPILRPAWEVTEADLEAASAVIAGSPVYFGSMAAELKQVFDRHIGLRRKMAGKVGAAFATSGHRNGGKETTLLSILQALLIYGMVVVGDPIEASGHYGVACSGSVDDETLTMARQLGTRVARLASTLSSSPSKIPY